MFGKKQLIKNISNEIELLRRDFIMENMNASVNQTQVCFIRAIDILNGMRPRVLEKNMKVQNMDNIGVAYWIVQVAAYEFLRDIDSDKETYFAIANYVNEKRYNMGHIEKKEYERNIQLAKELS